MYPSGMFKFLIVWYCHTSGGKQYSIVVSMYKIRHSEVSLDLFLFLSCVPALKESLRNVKFCSIVISMDIVERTISSCMAVTVNIHKISYFMSESFLLWWARISLIRWGLCADSNSVHSLFQYKLSKFHRYRFIQTSFHYWKISFF